MTNASSKVDTAILAIQATSVEGILRAIANSATLNMVRFASGYVAENFGNAFAKKALGESGRGRGKGQGVGHFISPKLTGLAYNAKGGKLTVIATVKDATHRQATKEGGFAPVDDREYGWASRTVADPVTPSRNMEWIEVCENFGPWRRISLVGLPIFDAIADADVPAFASDLRRLRELGVGCHKLNAKVDSIKQKAKKAGGTAKASDGSTVEYHQPKGSSVTLRETDKCPKSCQIEYEQRIVKNRGHLVTPVSQEDKDYFPAEWIQTEGRYAGRLSSEIEMLPLYMARLEDARKAYETLNAQLRPFEAGIIERHLVDGELTATTIELDGIPFEIQINEDKERDLIGDSGKMIEAGYWEEVTIPASRGSWVLTRADVAVPA